MGTFLHRSMHNFIHYAKSHGHSMSQIGALFAIHRQGTCAVNDIGEYLGISPPAASQMLNRLVEQGLIQRTEDPEDRRLKRLVLTDKGQETVQQSIRARQHWLQRLAESLTMEEQAEVSAALDLLNEKAAMLDEAVTV
jgi:DNA-binding MarR family transcriptional regulator